MLINTVVLSVLICDLHSLGWLLGFRKNEHEGFTYTIYNHFMERRNFASSHTSASEGLHRLGLD